jgi:hypothetical protein
MWEGSPTPIEHRSRSKYDSYLRRLIGVGDASHKMSAADYSFATQYSFLLERMKIWPSTIAGVEL